MGQLHLGFAAQSGPHQHGAAFLRQFIHNEGAVGAVVQGNLQIELLGDAQGGKNVVGAVGVGLQGDFPAHYRPHGVQLHVKIRFFLRLALFIGFPFLLIFPGFEEQPPEQGGGAHPGGRDLLLAAVNPLGIFAEGYFHRRRVLDHHFIHPLAAELDGAEGAAHHIGAAGAGDGAGNAGFQRLGKALVHGVDGVNAPHLGGNGVGGLVDIVAHPAHNLFLQADVAVGLHKARRHQAARSVINFRPGGRFQPRAHGGNFPVVSNEDVPAGDVRAFHGFYMPVFQKNHLYHPSAGGFGKQFPAGSQRCPDPGKGPQVVGPGQSVPARRVHVPVQKPVLLAQAEGKPLPEARFPPQHPEKLLPHQVQMPGGIEQRLPADSPGHIMGEVPKLVAAVVKAAGGGPFQAVIPVGRDRFLRDPAVLVQQDSPQAVLRQILRQAGNRKQGQVRLGEVGKEHQIGKPRFLRREKLHPLRLLENQTLAEPVQPAVVPGESLHFRDKVGQIEIPERVGGDIGVQPGTLHPHRPDSRAFPGKVQKQRHHFRVSPHQIPSRSSASHSLCSPARVSRRVFSSSLS